MIESVNTEKTIIEGKITNTETFGTIGETTNVDSTKTKEELTTYKLSTLGLFVNILQSILIALAISAIPLLLNSNTAIFYTSQPLYLMVVFLFASLILFRYWGLIIGAISLMVCISIVDIPLKINIINAASNMLQLLLMYLSFVFIQRIERKYGLINTRKNSTNTTLHKIYEFFIIIATFIYILFFFFASSINNVTIYILATGFLVFTILMSIIKKDAHYFYYTILIALFPSLVASICSATFSEVPTDLISDYIFTWTASNYILLQSIGYFVFTHYESWEVDFCGNKEIKTIDISSVLYYAAALLWNIFIIYLFRHDIFAGKSYMYFFPWALGNFLLLSNLFFSKYDDAKGSDNYFKWYEDRVVVVEQNTSVIITIISFLLPLSGVLTKVNVPDILTFIFISNIFCACFSVGLIWVPKSNVKFIALLKTIKSIFYTYSLILLLMSAIMIMYTYKYQLVAL